MCGIFGFLRRDEGRDPERLQRMAAALLHRGPDEGGTFEAAGVAVGSRRLAIVDRAHGRQPLSSETGGVVLVCNGEIYNAPVLREELEHRHRFRTASDVEVLVHLYEEEGLGFLDRAEGMFALALWDRERGRLVLARDRAGEKPLFYRETADELTFASELRALRGAPEMECRLDAAALRLYLALGYFPAPFTPYAGVRKLGPGEMLVLHAGERLASVTRWWDPLPLFAGGARSVAIDLPAAAATLRSLVSGSVHRQLVGEVPVGVALSGGLDSAWIAAHARRAGPLHTFTVAFADERFDESDAARELAGILGTTHHEVRADAASLSRAIEIMGTHMDEPLGDPAVLPTLLLAEEAKREVTVLLGGEGADELFGGYPTYTGHLLARGYARWPRAIREGIIRPLVRRLPPSDGKVPLEFLLKRFVAGAEEPQLRRHLSWFGVIPLPEVDALLAPLRPFHANLSSGSPTQMAEELLGAGAEWGDAVIAPMLYLDFRTYLAEGLLTKLDRVAMSRSLESRAPYLSRDVIQFAAGLHESLKVRGLQTKRVLREAARRDLPEAWLRRRKRGLSVPLGRLFRRELREWVRSELAVPRIQSEGVLEARRVEQILEDHLSGRQDRSRALWTLLSLVRWYRLHGAAAEASLAQPELRCALPVRDPVEESFAAAEEEA